MHSLMMYFNTRHFLTLAIILHVTYGNTINDTNVGNSVCNPAEIQQVKNKYCKSVVNSTTLTNEQDFNIVLEICYDLIKEFKTIVLDHKEVFYCTEIQECLSDNWPAITVCGDILKDYQPLQNNESESIDQTVAKLKATLEEIIFVTDIILGIMFIIGITTNGLLAVIFIRHKRARNDMMLISLTVADILSLIINMPIHIAIHVYKLRDINVFTSFSSDICGFISEYTLVIISFERFRAVFMKTEIRKEQRFPNCLKITGLWVMGLLYATICALVNIYLIDGDPRNYRQENRRRLSYAMVAIEGVLPVILITVFSVLASIQLKKLANNFPGERTHHLQLINDRFLAAKALIVLVALFLISYMPHNIHVLLRLSYYSSRKSFYKNILLDLNTWSLTDVVTHTMTFLNSALNPVVLYFLSSKFRNYFKSYLSCKFHDLE